MASYELIVPKAWGEERWIVNNDLYCAKLLVLRPGYECSLHYHPIKDETFHVLEGSCYLDLNGTDLLLARGETIRIRPTTPHSFWTSEPAGCVILEISTTHSDGDVVRLRPSRRVSSVDESIKTGNCT